MLGQWRHKLQLRLLEQPVPLGTFRLGAISTTSPFSSGKPRVSTWLKCPAISATCKKPL